MSITDEQLDEWERYYAKNPPSSASIAIAVKALQDLQECIKALRAARNKNLEFEKEEK